MPSGLYRFFGSFQSTHPSRGATLLHLSDGNSDAVSIHAPLAGCDDAAQAMSRSIGVFQSTHPSRGATFRHADISDWMDVSIHAPLAGCDLLDL